MTIDPATRDSLEICRTQTGAVTGSLLGCIDRCVTAPGRRLLAADLSAPLTDIRAIEARLALVQWLHEEPIRRARARESLKAMPDIGRALGRLVAGRGSPRDLALLRDGLQAAAALRSELEAERDRPDLLAALLPDLGGHARQTRLELSPNTTTITSLPGRVPLAIKHLPAASV
jgi:DNA mismatch repair protein MutS